MDYLLLINIQLIIGLTLLLPPSIAHQPEDLSSFHDNKHAQDADHLKEHYDGVADIDTSKMTPEQLEWHYFKLHDYDNDMRLDGLEILSAMSHRHHEDDTMTWSEIRKQVAEELKQSEEMIETVMKQADTNHDGYIDYTEYVLSRQLDQDKVKS